MKDDQHFKCKAPEGYVQPDEPEAHDGHDYEGFEGGCERMQCAPPQPISQVSGTQSVLKTLTK